MRVKPGVKLLGVKPPTVIGMMIADGVYRSYAKAEMTVTSVTDGAHRPDSLHYVGMAFDVRTKNLPIDVSKAGLVASIRAALGEEWDVLFEYEGQAQEHLHLEFQP